MTIVNVFGSIWVATLLLIDLIIYAGAILFLFLGRRIMYRLIDRAEAYAKSNSKVISGWVNVCKCSLLVSIYIITEWMVE